MGASREEVAVGWWVAEKGAPLAYVGPTEVNQEAAKRVALAKSKANPGTAFQVRYHMNANAPAEARWEALDGGLTEVTVGEPKNAEQFRGNLDQSGNSGRPAPVVPKTEKETTSIWQNIRRWFT
jgi:hypothetical protein